MSRLRTAVVTAVVGGTVLTGGVLVATSATAAPAPVAAVAAVDPGGAPGTSAGGEHRPGRHGIRQWWKDLTDEQRACLEAAELTRPVGPLDDAERAALRSAVTAAAESCDVELPFPRARAFWGSLTDEQKQCLDDARVTRPLGPMTPEERVEVRAALKQAAQECGITLPERGAAPAPSASAT